MTAPEDRLAEEFRRELQRLALIADVDVPDHLAQAAKRAGYLPPEDVARVRGEAWDEGWRARGYDVPGMGYYTPNPYRIEGEGAT